MPRVLRERTVVAYLEHEGVPGQLHAHAHPRGAGVLAGVPERLGQHRLGDRLEVRRHLHALLPVHLQRQVLVVTGVALELPAQGGAGVQHRRGERTRERVAQILQRGLHLVGAAAPCLLAQAVLRPEREGDAEQPLHHALVDLARQVDARLEQSRLPLGVGGDPDAGRQRGGLAEGPHRLPLVVGELELLAPAVGEDHSQGAPAGGHGGARERGELVEVRVARRHPLLQALGDLHHAVLRQRHLRDRRLLEAAVYAGQQVGIESVAPHGHHEPAALVVEHQPGASHRRLPAERHAEPVVEALAVRSRPLVHAGDELDDHVEGIGARRGRGVGHAFFVPTGRAAGYAGAPARPAAARGGASARR